jgi:hypothetical protein
MAVVSYECAAYTEGISVGDSFVLPITADVPRSDPDGGATLIIVHFRTEPGAVLDYSWGPSIIDTATTDAFYGTDFFSDGKNQYTPGNVTLINRGVVGLILHPLYIGDTLTLRFPTYSIDRIGATARAYTGVNFPHEYFAPDENSWGSLGLPGPGGTPAYLYSYSAEGPLSWWPDNAYSAFGRSAAFLGDYLEVWDQVNPYPGIQYAENDGLLVMKAELDDLQGFNHWGYNPVNSQYIWSDTSLNTLGGWVDKNYTGSSNWYFDTVTLAEKDYTANDILDLKGYYPSKGYSAFYSFGWGAPDTSLYGVVLKAGRGPFPHVPQYLSAHIYLCDAGTPTTTEVDGGWIYVPNPLGGLSYYDWINPLNPIDIPANTYLVYAYAPIGYEFVACGGVLTNPITIVLPENGAESADWYVSAILNAGLVSMQYVEG